MQSFMVWITVLTFLSGCGAGKKTAPENTRTDETLATIEGNVESVIVAAVGGRVVNAWAEVIFDPGVLKEDVRVVMERRENWLHIESYSIATGVEVNSSAMVGELKICIMGGTPYTDETTAALKPDDGPLEIEKKDDLEKLSDRLCFLTSHPSASFKIGAPLPDNKLSDPECFDPDLTKLVLGETMMMCDGSVGEGELDLSLLVAENIREGIVINAIEGILEDDLCEEDGQSSCITTAQFPAAQVEGLNVKVVAGQVVAGVAGAVGLPVEGDVLANVVYGNPNIQNVGTLTLPPASRVLENTTAYGNPGSPVVGTATLPTPNYVLQGVPDYGDPTDPRTAQLTVPDNRYVLSGSPDYGDANDLRSGTLTLPIAQVVLTGSPSYGDPEALRVGSLTLPLASDVVLATPTFGNPDDLQTPSYDPGDLPDVGNVLTTDTVHGANGTLTLPAVGHVLSGTGTYGNPASAMTPTLTLPSAVNVLSGSGTYGNPGSVVTPTLTLPPGNHVLNSVGTFGAGGTAVTASLTLPDVKHVLTAINYGDSAALSTGTLAIPLTSRVYTGTTYGVSDSLSTGTLTIPEAGNVLNTASAYGITGALVTPTLTLPVANVVLQGSAAYGNPSAQLTPILTLPETRHVLAATTYGNPSAIQTGTLTLPEGRHVLNTASAYGVTGSLTTPTLTIPGAGSVLTGTSYGDSVSTTNGTLTLPSAGQVNSAASNYGDPSSPTVPSLTLPSASNVLTGTGAYGVGGSSETPAYTPDFPEVGHVLSSDTVDGNPGTLTIPSSGHVLSGTGSYGNPSSPTVPTLTLPGAGMVRVASGDYGNPSSPTTPTLANCSTDGEQSCYVTGVFRAANVSGLSAWDIRSGVDLAGFSGSMAFNCRNTSDVTYYNYEGAVGSLPTYGVTDALGSYEEWDTIDHAQGITASSAFGAGYICDSSLWVDRTADGSCDSGGDDCVYEDQVTQLQWSEAQTSGSWPEAMETCHNLTFASQSDWRLPTQLEMLTAMSHGIKSTQNSSFVSNFNSNFWSATTSSNSPDDAWYMSLGPGLSDTVGKGASRSVLCVR